MDAWRITYLIRGESLGFAEDLKLLRRWLVERVHHEVQVGSQCTHACYFRLLCPWIRNNEKDTCTEGETDLRPPRAEEWWRSCMLPTAC